MDLDPILSALSKLEQSINDRYNDLNNKYQLVHTQLEEFNNKFTILNEKVDSILSIANELHTTSPTIHDAAPDTPKMTKRFPFESMLQTWQSYCKDNNTTIIPKAETKLSGWVRDT
jgi:regulator of replication initiation timing